MDAINQDTSLVHKIQLAPDMKTTTIMLAEVIANGAAAPAQVTSAETRQCSNYGEAHPDMPPEFSQFDFIV